MDMQKLGALASALGAAPQTFLAQQQGVTNTPGGSSPGALALGAAGVVNPHDLGQAQRLIQHYLSLLQQSASAQTGANNNVQNVSQSLATSTGAVAVAKQDVSISPNVVGPTVSTPAENVAFQNSAPPQHSPTIVNVTPGAATSTLQPGNDSTQAVQGVLQATILQALQSGQLSTQAVSALLSGDGEALAQLANMVGSAAASVATNVSPSGPQWSNGAPAPRPVAPTLSPSAPGPPVASFLPGVMSPMFQSTAREKNRQAQRRFRERQKGLIMDLKGQVDELQQKVDEAQREIMALREENAILKASLEVYVRERPLPALAHGSTMGQLSSAAVLPSSGAVGASVLPGTLAISLPMQTGVSQPLTSSQQIGRLPVPMEMDKVSTAQLSTAAPKVKVTVPSPGGPAPESITLVNQQLAQGVTQLDQGVSNSLLSSHAMSLLEQVKAHLSPGMTQLENAQMPNTLLNATIPATLLEQVTAQLPRGLVQLAPNNTGSATLTHSNPLSTAEGQAIVESTPTTLSCSFIDQMRSQLAHNNTTSCQDAASGVLAAPTPSGQAPEEGASQMGSASMSASMAAAVPLPEVKVEEESAILGSAGVMEGASQCPSGILQGGGPGLVGSTALLLAGDLYAAEELLDPNKEAHVSSELPPASSQAVSKELVPDSLAGPVEDVAAEVMLVDSA